MLTTKRFWRWLADMPPYNYYSVRDSVSGQEYYGGLFSMRIGSKRFLVVGFSSLGVEAQIAMDYIEGALLRGLDQDTPVIAMIGVEKTVYGYTTIMDAYTWFGDLGDHMTTMNEYYLTASLLTHKWAAHDNR
jgi:hypothetical protein